jgi:hypothetical protein
LQDVATSTLRPTNLSGKGLGHNWDDFADKEQAGEQFRAQYIQYYML